MPAIERFGYVPQLLPADGDGFDATERWGAAMIAAPQVVNPGSRAFCTTVRDHADLLLVDPKTSAYQFEGYMSLEEARAVPYSPGRTTLGSLWQPRDFELPARRRELIDGVFGLQSAAGAGRRLAPYFAVPRADHPWLEVALATASEALAIDAAAGLVLQVELDALLGDREGRIGHRFAALGARLILISVIDFDERQASPEEARAVLDLVVALGDSGAAAVPMHSGRFGLLAMAAGAAGTAGGGLELETHPRRYLREGLVNLKSNGHYLPGALIRLPVRAAQALIDVAPEAAGSGPRRPLELVYRRRLAAALASKRDEAADLAAAADPRAWLRGRLQAALEICRRGRAALDDGSEPLAAGSFHYLEVLLELAGGPAASRPEDPGV